MTMDELIRALRLCVNEGELKDPCKHCPADKEEAPTCMYTVMLEAADRLEGLDERVAIMEEGGK